MKVEYTAGSSGKQGTRAFNTPYTNIGKWMSDNTISRKSLSDKLGISPKALHFYLSGKVDFKLFAVKELIKLTGMTFEELMVREDEK